MTITSNAYTGDGSTVLFTFSWPYLEKDDVFVQINDDLQERPTAWDFVNTNTIEFVTAPPAGARVSIYRDTNVDDLYYTFYPGSTIKAKSLNENFEQTLFVAQESQNRYLDVEDGGTINGDVIFNGDVIINKDPTEDNHAVNKQYMEEWTTKEFVNVSGDTMVGPLNVNLPVAPSEAVPKSYVDGILVNSGGDLSSLPTTRFIEYATAGQTVFTYPGSFSPGNELVFVNGAQMARGYDYNANGLFSIVFTSPLLEGAVVELISYNNIKYVEIKANTDTLPFTRWVDTATAGQTVFTGTGDGTITLAYSPGMESVYLNGALLTRDVDYAANDKATVTLIQGAVEGDILEVHSGNYIQTGVPESAAGIKYTYPGGVEQTVQKRLEQYVSVKDFGAVGDGITDDTVAVKNAAANGIPAYFPAGSYKLTEPIQGDFFSTGGVTVSGGPVKIRTTAWGFIANPDTNDTSWQRKIGTPNQMYSDLYLGGNLSVGKLDAFELSIQPTDIQWDGTTLTFTLPDPGVPDRGYDGKNVYVTDSVSGFGNGYNTAAGTERFTLKIVPGKDITPLLSTATTSLVFYRPADPVGSIIVSKDYEKIEQYNIQPAYSIYIGRDATRPLDAPFLVSEFGTYRKNADAPDVGIIRSSRLSGFDGNKSTRFALSVDGDGGTYQQNQNVVDYAGSTNFVMNRYGTAINRDDSLQKDPDGMLYISCNNSTMTDAITITNFNSAGSRINFLSSTNFVGGTSPNNSADDRQCSIENNGGAVGELAFRTPKGGEGTNIRMALDYRGLELFNNNDSEFQGLIMEDTAVPGARYKIQITNGALVATQISSTRIANIDLAVD